MGPVHPPAPPNRDPADARTRQVVHAKVIVAGDVVSFGTVNFNAWVLYRDYPPLTYAGDSKVVLGPAGASL